MKLSEAILLGSVGSEQGFGIYSVETNSKGKCAIGAALLAAGHYVDENNVNGTCHAYAYLRRTWPWVTQYMEIPQVVRLRTAASTYSLLPKTIGDIIWMLNDITRWTRPQIAAWVAEQEAIYDVEPSVSTPVEERALVTKG